MLLLALETTGEIGGVALFDESRLLGSVRIRHGLNLSGHLLRATLFLLESHRFNFRAVEAFVVDVGPGSFTGLKIGVMLAKTWAHVLGKPLSWATAFEACALEALPGWIGMVVLPARKEAVYVQVLASHSQRLPTPLTEPQTLRLEQLPEWKLQLEKEEAAFWTRAPFCLVGAGGWQQESKFLSLFPGAPLLPVWFPRPEKVAEIGWYRLQQGETVHPFSLVPLYLQPPSIHPGALRFSKPSPHSSEVSR